MSSDVLSGTKVVLVNSGQTVHNRKIGPVRVSGVLEQEILNVLDGGKAINTKVVSGGQVYVESGAVVSGTHVVSGGSQTVYAGGKAFDTVISAGVGEVVAGTSTDCFVSAGAEQFLFKGGESIGATVYGGVAGSGKIIGAKVESNGNEFVDAGGVSSACVVHSGGQEYVEKAGTLKNAVIDGGLVVLDKGAKTAGTIKFEDGGRLVVSGGKMPKAEITDFSAGDVISLAGVKYSKSDKVTVPVDGEVEITAGKKHYILHIAGASTTDPGAFSYGGGNNLTTTNSSGMGFLAPTAPFTAAAPAALPAVASPVSPPSAASGHHAPASHAGLLTQEFWSRETAFAYAVMSAHGASI